MGKMNYERAASRQRVSERGGDPIQVGFARRRRKAKWKRPTNWRWIRAKYEGECVSKGCKIEVGDRCRYNVGTKVIQCVSCAEEFGVEVPDE